METGPRGSSALASSDAPAFRVSEYAETILLGRSDTERYRMLVCDLPRRFHAASPDVRARCLADPPPLTSTRWDALLAAVAEHVAILHGCSIPSWCDEPERHLRIPWAPLSELSGGAPSSAWIDAPGAFVRHGVLIDPASLDARGGEREYGCLI